MALSASEQKQIREALCAIAVRGARYPEELETVRQNLTKQFEALKEAAGQPAAAKTQSVHPARDARAI
ncbi:hypothetical protein J8I87_06135 [Paraburkholderia sp. LEh10]|uniref:hypothetical protein n=1 Tax=Paraburkholderia sp. LEh10 TaxID=2821353 RepID=UPI001AE4ADB2|nr:hypothetical protein [Paraburkholderia sp. LEh10]MBP0589303.1 hypothetical protein [Paraburkholderia sp. LEh10]